MRKKSVSLTPHCVLVTMSGEEGDDQDIGEEGVKGGEKKSTRKKKLVSLTPHRLLANSRRGLGKPPN